MSSMTMEDWVAAAGTLATSHAAITGERASRLRQVLVDLDRLMRAAPVTVLEAYRHIPEPRLSEAGKSRAEELVDGPLHWLVLDASSEHPPLWPLAVQIRAVDRLLADRAGYNGQLVSARQHLAPDGGSYVLPMAGRRSYRRDGDGLGSTYERRGILRHRIIPKRLGGLEVRVATTGTVVPGGKPGPWRLGAALTPDLALDAPSIERRFVVRAINSSRWPALLAEQVARSREEAADVAVWPELAVAEKAAETLAEELGKEVFGSLACRLQVVVAGSRHEILEDGRAHNVATVLTGKGRPVDFHRKIVAYDNKELGTENLKSGDSVLVLACDGFLASVAICKDFCDAGLQLPWNALDVDLVLVPSMGDEGTMLAHLDKARPLRTDRDVRTFVVQQVHPTRPETPLGLVLPAPRTVPRETLGLRQDESWRTYET